MADAKALLRDWVLARSGDEADWVEQSLADLAAGVPEESVFAAAFGRPLDYYTGLVFELSLGNGRGPVAGGGRYDGLMRMLGADRDVPAIGFTVQLPGTKSGTPSS